MSDRSGSVDPSRDKLRSFCVRAPEYDGEMSVINPPSFPINFRLYSGKPRIAKDGFVVTKVGEEELERGSGGSGSHIQNSVVSQFSASVFGPIDIKEFLGFRKLFNGKFEPFGVGEVHEVFGCS